MVHREACKAIAKLTKQLIAEYGIEFVKIEITVQKNLEHIRVSKLFKEEELADE